MVRKLALSLLFLIGTAAFAAAAEMVTFKGEDQETVTARLTKPQGESPSPAIILVHGVLGFDKHYDAWAERLASWGYVALQIGNFGSSGELTISKVPSEGAQNLCDAKSYLSGLPSVDQKRIGVMGWSLSAASILTSYCVGLSAQRRENPFRVGVAFYPYCFKPLVEVNMPILLLTGELDDWCPTNLWRERMRLRKTDHEVVLKVYPGAYHCFDIKGANTNYMGHRLQYNPTAAADSIVRVKKFLAKHLK